MNLIFKIFSAILAFFMAVIPEVNLPERKCEPKFTGTFIQSWMSCTWDDERWQTEIENMKAAGIEYLILQDIANQDYRYEGSGWTVYYDTELDCFDEAERNPDVVEAALRNCEGTGIKVFVGLALYDDFWTEGAMTGQYGEVCAIMADMIEEIYGKYYAEYSDCFYGWYFTPELNNVLTCQVNINGFADGLNVILDRINKVDASLPLLMSPFFAEYLASSETVTLVNLVRLLNKVNFRDGDIIAPQDAIGAKWTSEENLEDIWEMYAKAVDSCDADITLWANCENFTLCFEDSPIAGIFTRPETENKEVITSTLDRFVWQMDIASRYAENIITFSYNHYFSPELVNPAFIETYIDYVNNGFVLESEAPTAPEFSKSAAEDGVQLTWTDSQDNFGIAYYRIEKNGKFLARVELSGLEAPELAYYDESGTLADSYTIVAYDAAGNASQAVLAAG